MTIPSASIMAMHVKINPAIVQDYSKGRASLEEFDPNSALHPNPVIPASTSTSEAAHQCRSLFCLHGRIT
jgi:hypothetical protein